jgi:hypothetical protein
MSLRAATNRLSLSFLNLDASARPGVKIPSKETNYYSDIWIIWFLDQSWGFGAGGETGSTTTAEPEWQCKNNPWPNQEVLVELKKDFKTLRNLNKKENEKACLSLIAATRQY